MVCYLLIIQFGKVCFSLLSNDLYMNGSLLINFLIIMVILVVILVGLYVYIEKYIEIPSFCV